ncbi:wd40 repeat [Echinococcus multilocularis]|uniref:WD repeat-containing protein 89 n=1 Tax=Echinococcus multilocularis TaxID=6211 RepID=A0A087VWQ0_ECHMU|nr:wd40 repeat [Echinococcus multilocularis]
MLKSLRKRIFKEITFTAAISTPGSVLVSCLEDQFAFFDFCSLKKSSYRVEGSSRCVVMDFARASTNTFLSGDFDGVVRLWDLRNPRQSTSASEAGRNFLPKGATFYAAAVSPDARLVCAGSCVVTGKRKQTDKKAKKSKRLRMSLDEEIDGSGFGDNYNDSEGESSAYLICWDTRQMGRPLLMLNDVHSDDVNHLVFETNSPSASSRLLSCADDGLVCLADLNAPPEDRLIEVFNAERQANYCGFFNPVVSTDISTGVYAFDNMRSHFTAWPLASEEDDFQWQRLKTPPHARYLLSATRLPSNQATACLLSTSAVKRDLRLSLVNPENTKVVARRRLFKEEVNLDSDAFYADVLGSSTMEGTLEVLVVTRHSVHRLLGKVTE